MFLYFCDSLDSNPFFSLSRFLLFNKPIFSIFCKDFILSPISLKFLSGNIIFKQFNDAELKIIEDTMNNLSMGKLKIKEGALQTTLRNADHPNLFKNVATFQDFVATVFKDSINIIFNNNNLVCLF